MASGTYLPLPRLRTGCHALLISTPCLGAAPRALTVRELLGPVVPPCNQPCSVPHSFSGLWNTGLSELPGHTSGFLHWERNRGLFLKSWPGGHVAGGPRVQSRGHSLGGDRRDAQHTFTREAGIHTGGLGPSHWNQPAQAPTLPGRAREAGRRPLPSHPTCGDRNEITRRS